MRRPVEHARMLLETKTQPVKTIARAAGYKDESSFRKAFRRIDTIPTRVRLHCRSGRPLMLRSINI
ncbi:helix-turn-helix domain-containing protein [Bradyrhizobium sp. PMVTL-01]|uniref:helix-turn-helix domain-containing protein n=1 Tax=unclassified Bradyrhizobium TaxID=2631580 RepID=UPI003F6EA248